MSESLQKQQIKQLETVLDAYPGFKKMAPEKKMRVATGLYRTILGEPLWSLIPMFLSALAGLLALIAAVLHVIKQVNQLHRNQNNKDQTSAPAKTTNPLCSKSVVHIDHYTPIMLALMSFFRWPHSYYIQDVKMGLLQAANVFVWGGIAIYVWAEQPHPPPLHQDDNDDSC